MQNGRNRIAAHGRTKAGFPVMAEKRTRRRKQGETGAKASALPVAEPKAPPAFPADVRVALPRGANVVERRKAPRKPHPNPAQTRRRKPGRKRRAVAREAATARRTALVPAPRRMAAPPRHPVTPAVIHLAYSGATVAGAALPLPPAPEPLVVARTTAADRPRNRVPAAPRKGLVAAIADWIRSVRRLTLVGLLPRKRRAPLPKPPTHLTAVSRPRSPAEAERLRHENEALRKRLATLEAIEALRSARGKAGA